MSFTVLGKMEGRTRICLGSKYKEFHFEIVKFVMFIRHLSENTHTHLNVEFKGKVKAVGINVGPFLCNNNN